MASSPEELLSQYQQQLSSVNEALKTAQDENKTELLDLKNKLTEVILLLQGNQAESAPKKVEDEESNEVIDDEFARFQREISQLEDKEAPVNCTENSGEDNAYVHNELCRVLSSMEGNKCRAPFLQPWGERGYHNAIIFSTDLEEEIDDIQDVLVKVMFCNPLCDEMKPCPYFLDGHCKFPDEKCRYSHGYNVKYSDLEEYTLPDYSNVERDSKCLVKYKDGLWYTAVVEKCLEGQKFFVKYSNSGDTVTVDAPDLLPLGQLNLSEDDSSSESSLSDVEYSDKTVNKSIVSNSESSEINYQVQIGGSPMGEWEQHTKGIGSKLMAKMGYVWGQGLGKHSDGRIEPVEAIVLPKGKSLDKCVEMRNLSGPESVEDRFKAEQVKQEERIKKLEKAQTPESSVFTFLNQNLGRNNEVNDFQRSDASRKRPSDESSVGGKSQSTDLNFEMYSVGEDIKKTKKEILKLQQSLKRNAERNEAACSQMKQKMAVQSNILKKLEAKEQRISNEINLKKNHKKIAVF